MFEDKVWKDVRTYADVVSARIVTEQLSNKEEGINNKKYWKNSIFLKLSILIR